MPPLAMFQERRCYALLADVDRDSEAGRARLSDDRQEVAVGVGPGAVGGDVGRARTPGSIRTPSPCALDSGSVIVPEMKGLDDRPRAENRRRFRLLGSGEPIGRSWLVRWSPLGGLLWFVGTVVAITIGTGSGDTAPEILARARSNEVGIGVWVIAALLYPLLLGWFVGGLATRLWQAGGNAEAVFALIGGTIFTVRLFLVDVIVFVPLSEITSKDESLDRCEPGRPLLALGITGIWRLHPAAARQGLCGRGVVDHRPPYQRPACRHSRTVRAYTSARAGTTSAANSAS
jgi:hypothetical protein